MSPGPSKLNPYAAAYVPIAKRRDDASNLAHVDSDSSKAFAGSSSQNATEFVSEEKGHILSSFLDYSSQEYSQVAGGHADGGQLEMDLAYLQTLFPSISEQSLSDVYFVNDCDLDAAYDMLSQLETLPDSLDIGDVSEPQILPEFANLKLKEVAGVASGASATSPGLPQPQK
uniref:CUE domain-containing protein n=1 Tax=Kalanchoe fedtschenkoi TaxID=63787 RepID=A0A7N0TA35_KALFE